MALRLKRVAASRRVPLAVDRHSGLSHGGGGFSAGSAGTPVARRPLHVVRILVQAATLVRAQRGKLVATPLGKSMLSDERQGSLPTILFHLAFWHTDLGYFGRGPATLTGTWGQVGLRHVEARILRPLLWFGLLEQSQ
jgi:hypothetical protein